MDGCVSIIRLRFATRVRYSERFCQTPGAYTNVMEYGGGVGATHDIIWSYIQALNVDNVTICIELIVCAEHYDK
ncbi:glycine receptor subunit alpha-2 [Plakobranchus ocellatus]|uniref:Glycine receptor subunit alpha-2 n=1 Tax=Plakobranchus ocellatus TaxID=259542 RepID=A0AAV3YN92_9GAST|nr:glycine receptor subunit alpha-2 [Plakobranchus ocellatus]